MARDVGHVVGTVLRRLIVGVGVNAKHAEVSRVTRPNPVVRVPAKGIVVQRGEGDGTCSRPIGHERAVDGQGPGAVLELDHRPRLQR